MLSVSDDDVDDVDATDGDGENGAMITAGDNGRDCFLARDTDDEDAVEEPLLLSRVITV